MKWFVAITTLTVVSAGVVKDPSENYGYEKYPYIPEYEEESSILFDSEETVDDIILEEYSRDPANNEYWLLTRANETNAIALNPDDIEGIKASVNFSKEIIFLAHGWNGDGRNEMNKVLTKAFLQNNDVNVIVLDWSKLAKKGYLTAKKGTPSVGRALGEFIKNLFSMGAAYNRMHLVGFSLGAHLVGCAGRQIEGNIKRITGLDPAGPLWRNDPDRITSNDAQYVEIIHTNTAFFGINLLSGDADFFPNGGNRMPGCMLNSCSHSKAYEYMESSLIYNRFLANECDSMDDLENNNCTGSFNLMGNDNLHKTRYGIFRINTGKDYPFWNTTASN